MGTVSLKVIPKKFISLSKLSVRTSDPEFMLMTIFLPEFTSKSVAHQGCLVTLFFFIFAIEMTVEIILYSCESRSVDICANRRLSNTEYSDDYYAVFRLRFVPYRCKMFLQDWIHPRSDLVLAEEESAELDRFGYLGGCITPGVGNLMRSFLVYTGLY